MKKNSRGTCRKVSILAMSVALGAAGHALAQQVQTQSSVPSQASDHQQIQEIVVTAQKREQSLSDVGIAITALSGETMARAGMRDTMSIVNSIPNMENSAIYGPGSNTNFALRGVAQNDHNDGTESPIATYFDDVYLIPNGAGSFPLYDMERVEVLRGPQGTLFGRNSTGGLIHFISAKPKDSFEADMTGQVGSYGTREVTGVLNIPVTDTLSARFAGQYHTNNGWVHNLTGNQPNGGELNTSSMRGQLRWRASSKIIDTLKVSYDDASGATSGTYHEAIGVAPGTGDQYLLGPGQNFYGTGAQRDSNGVGNITNRQTDNGQPRALLGARALNVTNHLEADLGKIKVTAVTGYINYKRDQVEDCDGTQVDACDTRYITRSKLLSQEVRANGDFGSLRFTAGLFAMQQRLSLDNIAPLYLNTVNPIAETVRANQLATSYALFGNVEYDVVPNLTLIGGLRGSKDKKHFQQTLDVVTPCAGIPFAGYAQIDPVNVPYCGITAQNVFTDQTAGALTHINKDTWSAKVELDYKPAKGTLLYVSFSRGVKSPGFNNGFISAGLTPNAFQFQAETLLSYEAGLKTQFLDRRASFNLSSFYYDYKDYDTLSYAGIGSVITNNNARLYGGEAELQLRPARGLSINAFGGYTNSKLYNVPNASLVYADRQMPLAPQWTAGGTARYETAVGDRNYRFGIQLDMHARASYYTDPGNDSAAKLPSIGLLDGRIDLTAPDDRFTIALTAKNLLNKYYITSIFLEQGIAGYRFGSYGPPRWFGLELSYHLR